MSRISQLGFLRLRIMLPLLLMTLIVGAACGDDDSDSGPSTDEPQVLRSRMQGEPGTLDPQRATDTDSISILRQM